MLKVYKAYEAKHEVPMVPPGASYITKIDGKVVMARNRKRAVPGVPISMFPFGRTKEQEVMDVYEEAPVPDQFVVNGRLYVAQDLCPGQQSMQPIVHDNKLYYPQNDPYQVQLPISHPRDKKLKLRRVVFPVLTHLPTLEQVKGAPDTEQQRLENHQQMHLPGLGVTSHPQLVDLNPQPVNLSSPPINLNPQPVNLNPQPINLNPQPVSWISQPVEADAIDVKQQIIVAEEPVPIDQQTSPRTTMTVLKQLCINCGRVRSRSYHLNNPITSAAAAVPAFCGRCQKNTSCTSDASSRNRSPRGRSCWSRGTSGRRRKRGSRDSHRSHTSRASSVDRLSKKNVSKRSNPESKRNSKYSRENGSRSHQSDWTPGSIPPDVEGLVFFPDTSKNDFYDFPERRNQLFEPDSGNTLSREDVQSFPLRAQEFVQSSGRTEMCPRSSASSATFVLQNNNGKNHRNAIKPSPEADTAVWASGSPGSLLIPPVSHREIDRTGVVNETNTPRNLAQQCYRGTQTVELPSGSSAKSKAQVGRGPHNLAQSQGASSAHDHRPRVSMVSKNISTDQGNEHIGKSKDLIGLENHYLRYNSKLSQSTSTELVTFSSNGDSSVTRSMSQDIRLEELSLSESSQLRRLERPGSGYHSSMQSTHNKRAEQASNTTDKMGITARKDSWRQMDSSRSDGDVALANRASWGLMEKTSYNKKDDRTFAGQGLSISRKEPGDFKNIHEASTYYNEDWVRPDSNRRRASRAQVNAAGMYGASNGVLKRQDDVAKSRSTTRLPSSYLNGYSELSTSALAQGEQGKGRNGCSSYGTTYRYPTINETKDAEREKTERGEKNVKNNGKMTDSEKDAEDVDVRAQRRRVAFEESSGGSHHAASRDMA